MEFLENLYTDNYDNFEEWMEIINSKEIIILLNAYMGSDWYKRLDFLIEIQRRKYEN